MTDQTDSQQLTKIEAGSPPAVSPFAAIPAALALFLDDKLFERAKQIAKYMSEAQGFMPPHLLNKPQACFAVLERAITWRLSPFAVAQSTYETPGGRVGYEGKLCQAVLENSGHLEGGVTFEHVGDWTRVQGKFAIKESTKGTKYPAPTWTDEDAKGLAVIVRAQVKGERKPRELRFELVQAFPRNSTLWATDPRTQVCYAAVRRFASVAVPGLFMGVPFDIEDVPVRDMGDAQVVVEMPTSTEEAKAEAAQPQAAAVSRGNLEAPQAVITAGQARIVKIKMQNAALSDTDLKTKFGFDQDHIPMAQLNAVLAWVDNPMG